nr:hypothetical protein [Pandoravirus massiliensis]
MEMDIETDVRSGTSPAAPCLTTMPPEILANIIAAIDRPLTLWALRSVSSLFASVSPRDLAVRWGAQRMHRLLASGAPIEVVTAAMTARGRSLSASAVVDAVTGKRLDVVAFVSDTLLVRLRPSLFPPSRRLDRRRFSPALVGVFSLSASFWPTAFGCARLLDRTCGCLLFFSSISSGVR